MRDLDIRASLIASAVQEPLQDLIQTGNRTRMLQFFDRITNDERLFAMGFCPSAPGQPVLTPTLPAQIRCTELQAFSGSAGQLLRSASGPLLVSVRPLEAAGAPVGNLVVVHDMSFIARRSAETRKYLFLFFVGLGATVALITVVIAQLSWRGWVQGLRSLLRGEGILRPARSTTAPELQPIARDLKDLILDLERQYRPLDGSQRIWDQEALRATLRSELHGNDVIVVSNREPYIHVRNDGSVRVQRPASGLVTALEPVMRACSGTWIAHGSGSGDREAVDRHDRVPLPPGEHDYLLRRLWLTDEQEQGYYYGFANEGLWPLCHVAHVRPVFREQDWEHYRQVNQQFADAVVAEARGDDPIVLVQDYHFALLPAMVRRKLPKATVLSFWHIPWPNPESFGICPWRSEILEGMLGSTILGFHTQFHCRNFIDTVDRYLEARIEYEGSTISYGGHRTSIEPYPISIQWPPADASRPSPQE